MIKFFLVLYIYIFFLNNFERIFLCKIFILSIFIAQKNLLLESLGAWWKLCWCRLQRPQHIEHEENSWDHNMCSWILLLCDKWCMMHGRAIVSFSNLIFCCPSGYWGPIHYSWLGRFYPRDLIWQLATTTRLGKHGN